MKIPVPAAIAAAVLLATSAGPGPAAEPGAAIYENWLSPGPPPLERFVKPLGLSRDQQKKLAPVFAEAQAKAAADDAEGRARTQTPETSAAMLGVREADFRVQLAAVLTPEQLSRFEQLSASRAANMRQPYSHPAHGHSDMNSASPAVEESRAPAPPPTPPPAQ